MAREGEDRSGNPSGRPEDRVEPDAGEAGGESERTEGQDPVWRVGHERVVTRDHGGELPGLNTWGAESASVEQVDDEDDDTWAPTTHRDGPERPRRTRSDDGSEGRTHDERDQ
jgi:hypothetical protein